MARPTVRIPLWASGGAVTDPGAGKESTGWSVSERPPSRWWNWILNSLGQWVTHIDEGGIAQAWGKVRTGGSGSVLYNGANITSIADSGANVLVNLGVTFASTDSMVVLMTADSPLYQFSCAPNTTSQLVLAAWNSATSSAWSLPSNAHNFSIRVYGELA